jgi:Flp pilus assembly protein TadD
VVHEKKVLGRWALACVRGEDPGDIPRRRVAASLSGAATLHERLLENPKDTAALLALARLASGEGDQALARLILERILETRPRDAKTLNLLGVSAWHLGDEQEAHALFLRTLEADPSSLPARLNLAALYHRYGISDEAKATLAPVRADLRTADLSDPAIHPLVKVALGETGQR